MMNPAVPARIHAPFPDIKLIAILRNPIDRAYSSYRMTVRPGSEKRLEQEALQSPPNPGQPFTALDCLGMGLYGKILEGYLKYSPLNKSGSSSRKNLQRNPRKSCMTYMVSLGPMRASRPAISTMSTTVAGSRNTGVSSLSNDSSICWRNPCNANIYCGWTFLFDQWNTKPNQGLGLPVDLRNELADYYRADVAHLEQLFQVQVPWLEFLNPTPCDTRAASSPSTILWKNSPSKPIKCMPSGTN